MNSIQNRRECGWLNAYGSRSCPKIFSIAGIKYTIVDDYHFLSSGLSEQERTGYYLTEEQGHILKVFTINQKLRYFIPFRNVEETIEYFKQMATESGDRAIVMIDDGEKFGLWPHTINMFIRTAGWKSSSRLLKIIPDG